MQGDYNAAHLSLSLHAGITHYERDGFRSQQKCLKICFFFKSNNQWTELRSILIFQVLAATCLMPNGHEKVLEAITMAGESNRKPRFLPIVEGVMPKAPESLKVSRTSPMITEDVRFLLNVSECFRIFVKYLTRAFPNIPECSRSIKQYGGSDREKE